MKIDLSIEYYLQQTKIPLRLATMTDLGWPMIVSLWYLYDDGVFYCATPLNAKITSWLEREPRCGFEVAADHPPYCGVRGRALATINKDRGLEILERLLERYLGNSDNPLAQKLLTRSEPEVAISLAPQKIFSWNFSDRMADSLKQTVTKVCPE